MIDVANAFPTASELLIQFFQQQNLGFYIPLYQRDYSWDTGNIDQLMEDIISGVDKLFSDDKDIHFMGTLILVNEKSPKENIKPIDHRALPKIIQNVIDGQQRISTVCILACMLYQRIDRLSKKIPKTSEAYSSLIEESNYKLNSLSNIFSVDLLRGTPTRKPKIIRGQLDEWTFDGSREDCYRSDVSSYLADTINAVATESSFPNLPSEKTTIGKNIRRLKYHLDYVENAHNYDGKEDATFPPAWTILEKLKKEEYIWSYDRPELKKIIDERGAPLAPLEENLCALIQIFTFCHYLLERCCFTIIEPTNDDWAFDMFQSLNATGTPLTAYETFKPLVVNLFDINGGFKGSETEKNMTLIDDILNKPNNNPQKTKLTNEFLTTFALIENGHKLPNQFSLQRRYLVERLASHKTIELKAKFVQEMRHLAVYWSEILSYNPSESTYIRSTGEVEPKDRAIASMCILYNKDSNHKMAHTILSRFYSRILTGVPGAQQDFVDAIKAITAFYTIWRAASSNKGLDDVYRSLMKPAAGARAFSSAAGIENVTVSNLKAHLLAALETRGIDQEDKWTEKCLINLNYTDVKIICKFMLFIAAHNTISDTSAPGLMKQAAKDGSYDYLTPLAWTSKNLKTIEHIAPEKPKPETKWDESLYTGDTFHMIGNLTLLPNNINSSVSNSEWPVKIIYYKHISELDEDNLSTLQAEAAAENISLDSDTLELLKDSDYANHVKPIIHAYGARKWDKEIVAMRTTRICEITWSRIFPWLL